MKTELDADKVPLIFVRIRNLEQFKHFGENLTAHQVKSLCGINFPKFNAENGYEYYAYLKDLNDRFGEIIYGMPIIEDSEVHIKRPVYRNCSALRGSSINIRNLYCRCVSAELTSVPYSASAAVSVIQYTIL